MTLTEAASIYIQSAIAKEQGLGFRLSIKKTGCSGYSYLPSVVKEVNPQDQVMETDHGVTLYVDTAWLDLLRDVQVDYVEDTKSGLKQKRLIFTNPNESGRCGCGESFHVE